MAKGSKKVTLVLMLVLALVANSLAMASPSTAQSERDRAQAPPAPSGPPSGQGAIGPRGETPPLPPVLAQGDNGLLTSPPTLSSSLQRPVQGPDLSSETITATSRHRVDRNGRGTAALYQNPAFRRQGGRWVEVDSSLHPTGDRALPAAAEGALRPVRLGSSAERIVELGLDQGPVTMSSPGLSLGRPSLEGNSALYRDVATDTDMRYVVSDDGIKEELVLRSAAAPRSFTFHLADPSGQLGTLEPDGAGGFVFSNPVEQGVSLTLPAALAWEQGPEGEPVANDSTSAHLEVVPAGDGWDLTVALDEAWLEDKSFPVVLDPSLTYSANSGTGPVVEGYAVRDTSSCGTSCRLTRNAYLFAGSWGWADPVRSYLRYDFSSIPEGARVDSARFNAYMPSCMNTSTPDPCANKTWGITINPMRADWGTASTYAELAAATSGNSGGFPLISRSDIPGWKWWDIGYLVQDWVEGSRPNYGFAMRSLDESNTAAGPAFASSRWSVTGSRPYLSVSYTVVAPGTPAVAAYAGNGAARVHWGIPNSGGSPIDRYLIYAYQGNTFVGSKFVYCPCPTVAPFEGLTNGLNYHFAVYAHNSIGYSAAATSSAVTPTPALPTAPSPASASPGNAAARVDWAHPSTGAAAVDHYVVQAYDTDTGYVGAVTVTCPCPTIAPVGVLANGERYILAVFAHNEAGYGVPSMSGSVVPASNRPGPSGSVVAQAAPRAVDVSWQAPSTSGGASISSYTVRPYDVLTGYLGDAKAKTITCPCGTTAARIDGLAPGRTYVFAVLATTANGSGAPGLSGAAELANVPGAPTSLSAVPGDGRAALSWDASGTNGSPVTGYTVTASPGGATTRVAGDATSTMFEGLTNGTAYTFTAVATNAVGDSVASVASNEVTPQSDSSLLAPLVAPTSVVATRGDTQADVSWTKPTLSLPLVTTYDVTTYRASDGVELGTTSAGSTSSVTVTGLKNGTPVYFTVTARSLLLSGTSEPSNTITPAGPPFAPTDVVATRGDRQVEVSWNPPGPRPDGTPGDNGDPISSYEVTTHLAADDSVVSRETATTTSASITGLVNGQGYYAVVRAQNTLGYSAGSAPSSVVVPAGLPSPPANVQAVGGNGSAAVTWTASDPNGSPVLEYVVTASPGGAFRTAPGTSTSLDFGALTNGTTYTFVVQARNDVGLSAASASSNPVTPAGPPSTPMNVVATATGQTSATISWDPSDANGAPVTYTATSHPGDLTAQSTGTTAEFTGLTAGTTYTFTVVATNAAGSSPASAPSNPVTPGECTEEEAAAFSAAAWPWDCNPVVEPPEILWGVDSGARITEEYLQAVRDIYGDPAVWARYLHDEGATKEPRAILESELEIARQNNLLILVIDYNPGTEQLIGYQKALDSANTALRNAQRLGIPNSVAIFANVEPDGLADVDSEWIKGWFDGISAGGYEVGYYGDPEESEFSTAYCQAVSENASIGSQSVLWSFQPFVGRTTKADAPDFAPQLPPCAGSVLAWQYGLEPPPEAPPDDFPREPHIDTDLFKSELIPKLWTP